MPHPRARVVSLAAVAFVVIASVRAQTRPDFSGRWTTDPDPAVAGAAAETGRRGGGGGGGGGGGARGRGAARGDMGSGWGSTINITQDATRMTVEYAFFTRGDMQPPLRFAYTFDGSATTNTVMMGHGIQRETSKLRWDGDALVIATTHAVPAAVGGGATTIEVTRRLSLESPSSLVVETTRAGVAGGPPTTTRAVYRKLTAS
jgi:hypothetical protein